MSMKKFTKKMLAIVAAGAMTMGLAMPVFAEGADTTNNAKEAYISKVYNTEVGKAETFSFTATQITDGEDVIKTAHAVTIPTISFEATDLGTTTKRAKIDCGTFTEAGKYSYTVKESADASPAVAKTEYEELIMSKAEYRMDVYVQETDSGLEINKIIVNILKDNKGAEPEEGTGKVDIGDSDQNGFKFVNTYVQEAGTGERPDPTNPDPDYTTNGSLNASKKVEKNVKTGETTEPTTGETFSFTAVFTFPAGTDENTLGGVNANGTRITLTNGTTHTFTLTDGKNMKFTKLPVGTKITVTEAAKANYKGSVVVTLNGAQDSTDTATKYNEEIKVSDKKLGQTKNAVDVTNKFNNVPTTGIIMNTLPYVLMVALCAVALFGFVAFKHKKVQK